MDCDGGGWIVVVVVMVGGHHHSYCGWTPAGVMPFVYNEDLNDDDGGDSVVYGS